jgi:hypothetical protein
MQRVRRLPHVAHGMRALASSASGMPPSTDAASVPPAVPLSGEKLQRTQQAPQSATLLGKFAAQSKTMPPVATIDGVRLARTPSYNSATDKLEAKAPDTPLQLPSHAAPGSGGKEGKDGQSNSGGGSNSVLAAGLALVALGAAAFGMNYVSSRKQPTPVVTPSNAAPTKAATVASPPLTGGPPSHSAVKPPALTPSPSASTSTPTSLASSPPASAPKPVVVTASAPPPTPVPAPPPVPKGPTPEELRHRAEQQRQKEHQAHMEMQELERFLDLYFAVQAQEQAAQAMARHKQVSGPVDGWIGVCDMIHVRFHTFRLVCVCVCVCV